MNNADQFLLVSWLQESISTKSDSEYVVFIPRKNIKLKDGGVFQAAQWYILPRPTYDQLISTFAKPEDVLIKDYRMTQFVELLVNHKWQDITPNIVESNKCFQSELSHGFFADPVITDSGQTVEKATHEQAVMSENPNASRDIHTSKIIQTMANHIIIEALCNKLKSYGENASIKLTDLFSELPAQKGLWQTFKDFFSDPVNTVSAALTFALLLMFNEINNNLGLRESNRLNYIDSISTSLAFIIGIHVPRRFGQSIRNAVTTLHYYTPQWFKNAAADTTEVIFLDITSRVMSNNQLKKTL